MRGLAAATAEISSSWSPASASVVRSMPSPCALLAKTIAASAPRAASTAAGIPDCDGVSHAKWISWLNSPARLEYSIVTGTGSPAVSDTMPWNGYRGPSMNCVASRYAGPNVCPAIVIVPKPACSSVKRCGPVSVGVSVPVQRADHSPPVSLGAAPRSTPASTRVQDRIAGEVAVAPVGAQQPGAGPGRRREHARRHDRRRRDVARRALDGRDRRAGARAGRDPGPRRARLAGLGRDGGGAPDDVDGVLAGRPDQRERARPGRQRERPAPVLQQDHPRRGDARRGRPVLGRAHVGGRGRERVVERAGVDQPVEGAAHDVVEPLRRHLRPR